MIDSLDDMLPLVDEAGHVTGAATRRECHGGSRWLHPVVHLHIIDRYGRVYLQKRSASKKLYPGRWDTAVGGHIEYGESIAEALMRESREELNFYDFNPVFLDSYEYRSPVELELICVFACVGNFKIDPHNIEVDQGRFFTDEEIKGGDQEAFTPNFLSEYERFKPAFEALL